MEKLQKLRPISKGEIRKHEIRNITARFVEEINRICLDGRVKNITTLEKDLLLKNGRISEYAQGGYYVDAYTIQLAKRHYNIDIMYVLMNISDPEHSSPRRAGKKFDVYPPFDRKKLERHAPPKKDKKSQSA